MEDDRDIAELLIDALEGAGHEVLAWVANGLAALPVLLGITPPPDLLLLDYELPGQDGAQIARSIRNHYSALSILVCSANPESIHRFSGLDDVFFLQKPFRLVELMTSIQPTYMIETIHSPSLRAS